MSAENLYRPSHQPLIQSRAVQQEADQLATTVVQTAPRLDLDLGRARGVSLIHGLASRSKQQLLARRPGQT